MLTELDRLLESTAVFVANGNKVYRGRPHGPEVIFSLDITGEVVMTTYAKISSVIDESWLASNAGWFDDTGKHVISLCSFKKT